MQLSTENLLNQLLVLPWFNRQGFVARDMQGQDVMTLRTQAEVPFATQVPVITTATGTPKYDLRWRVVGRMCEGEMYFYNHTLLAWTVSTDYFKLPVTAAGRCGMASVTNLSTNAAAGAGSIDVTNSRCYLPALAATANLLGVFFKYEV